MRITTFILKQRKEGKQRKGKTKYIVRRNKEKNEGKKLSEREPEK